MRQGIVILSAVCLFLLFSSGTVTAQESDTLSKNSEEFFQQVSSILLNTPSKVNMEKSQALLDRLYAKWTIGRFNRAEDVQQAADALTEDGGGDETAKAKILSLFIPIHSCPYPACRIETITKKHSWLACVCHQTVEWKKITQVSGFCRVYHRTI